jgi:type IV pilus assembly protein PilN
MRFALNLASRPYVELGPLYARLRVLIAALALLAVPLWLFLRVEIRKASAAHARLAAVEQQIDTLQRQQQTFQSDMRQPRNAAVLQQSLFLNQMFQRKAFSWTAVMMDLENVLPGGVQVLNIDPVISRSGDVTIHLRVSGQRERAVELVRNLEHSRRFLFPRLADETAETAAQGGRGFEQVSADNVNFDILSEYNPLPPANATKSEVKGKAASTTQNHAAAPAPGHRGRSQKHAPTAPRKAGPP